MTSLPHLLGELADSSQMGVSPRIALPELKNDVLPNVTPLSSAAAKDVGSAGQPSF